jgi:predicted nucleotide-binding protein
MNKDEARELLEQNGFAIVSEEPLQNGHGVQLRTAQGPMLTVYNSGKCVPGGKHQHLITALLDGALKGPTVPVLPVTTDDTIFVVHGRDHNARDQLELVLHRLGLEPYVLQVTGGGGDTLIEALERKIGKFGQSGFGIVLATPDDVGYLKADGSDEAEARARQNVIMEMGMLLASLTRRRCAILTKGHVALPSNMGGVITIPFNDHVREAVPKLVQRLQEAGYTLTAKGIGLAQG